MVKFNDLLNASANKLEFVVPVSAGLSWPSETSAASWARGKQHWSAKQVKDEADYYVVSIP